MTTPDRGSGLYGKIRSRDFTSSSKGPADGLEIRPLTLKNRGFYSMEFIPVRNSQKVLADYAQFLISEGFLVTFVTEHNTPVMPPLKLYTRDKPVLDEQLKESNYQGA